MSPSVSVLAPYFVPAVNGGGPIRTLDALTDAAPDGYGVSVLTRDRDLGVSERLPVPERARLGRRRVRYVDARGFLGSVRLARAVCAERPDLEYLNSVFDARFSIMPLVLRRSGLHRPTTVLLAPRGEFDPGALRINETKKRAYLRVASALGLFRNVVWHASTETEAKNIRSVVGDEAAVVVRENETRLPRTAGRTSPPAGDALRLVVLGRISPKKRVHVVLEALEALAPTTRLSVQIVGPADDPSYARRCHSVAGRLPDGVDVEWLGSVPHDEALRLLAAAHIMVTATAGENFGHTIAEAMAVGRPVIVSDTTPWSDRVRTGGGTVVREGDPTAWVEALASWIDMSAAERSDRARRAADAFDRWRDTDVAPHVFDLATAPLNHR